LELLAEARSSRRVSDHRIVHDPAGGVLSVLAAALCGKMGLVHTAAWMSLGQITEVIAMGSLGFLLLRWRLKWIFACGLGFGVLRFAL